jgi:hypothetical protein
MEGFVDCRPGAVRASGLPALVGTRIPDSLLVTSGGRMMAIDDVPSPSEPTEMHHRIRRIAGVLIILAPAALAGQTATPRSDTARRTDGIARVTGTVREANGRPAAHVRVAVIGLGRETRTTLRGAFIFDSLPAATLTLEAVQIGAIPGRVVVELVAGQSTKADITLGRGVAVLETQQITAQWATEIERRARVSTSGYFVKPAEIAARGRNTPLAALLYQVPSVKVACARPSQCSVVMRGYGTTAALKPRYCVPSLYVDGFRDGLADFASIYSGDILAIEIYREVGRPFEFTDSNKCGAIAVWTKPMEPRQEKPAPPPAR